MKKYELVVEETDNGFSFKSKNEGFSAFELLGFLDWKTRDIEKQIGQVMKPNVVDRNGVIESGNE